MIFNHYTRIVDGRTVHIFNGFGPNDSDTIREVDEFVRLHDIYIERDWSMAGMAVTVFVEDIRVATLFKMTF